MGKRRLHAHRSHDARKRRGEAADKNGQAAELKKELEDLFNRENKSPRKDATSIPATFLRVTVEL
ncbi:MAG TPA: hypothetical protein VF420_16935 [Casimicrobiaceae bacterium]